MKKFFEIVLSLICVFAFFLVGAQKPDGSCELGWSLSCLAVATVSGVILGRHFFRGPVHVSEDTYKDLNRQIEGYARGMENGYEEVEFESDNVILTVKIHCVTTKSSFTDDAWGHTKKFTEYNWTCNIEVVDVKVLDKNNKPVEKHDFDDILIETEYESTSNWM